MAIVNQMDEAAFEEWVASRPAAIQAMIRRHPPGRLYLLKTTGQRVLIHSYLEDGTVKVDVNAEFNATVLPRRVFGISPDDLEECDLPVG